MKNLPMKRQIVSLSEIREICSEYGLFDLWRTVLKDPPIKPFKSDGCSGGWPDTWGEYNLYPACFLHDLKYWGFYPDDEVQRLIADAKLMVDVVEITGDVKLAEIMYLGVRVGGGSKFKRPYSFGFGRTG